MWQFIVYPLWFVFKLAQWLYYLPLRRIQSREEQGLCIACGYDIRHNPDRCPECGHPVTPTSKAFIERRLGEI